MLIVLLIESIFFAAVVLITLLVFHTTISRSYFVGILCIIFNIGMYTSPLTVMVPLRSPSFVILQLYYNEHLNYTFDLIACFVSATCDQNEEC